MEAGTPFNHDEICSPEALINQWSGLPQTSNPDISGIGVTIGFLGPAFLVFFLLSANYLFSYAPAINPFTDEDAPIGKEKVNGAAWKPNPVDVEFLRLFRWAFRIHGARPRIASILHECILNVCDIQLVAGLSIVISGFASLKNNLDRPITASDWYTIAYLAWFANTTHLAGLTALRAVFNISPTLRAIRVALMFVLLVLLIVALIPTGSFNWEESQLLPSKYEAVPTAAVPQSPAICYFSVATTQRLWDARCVLRWPGWMSSDPPFCKVTPEELPLRPMHRAAPFEAMLVAVVMLIFGFTTRCIKLMPSIAGALKRHVRRPASKWSKRLLLVLSTLPSIFRQRPGGTSLYERLWIDLVVLPSVGLFLCVRWTIDFFSSTLFEVFWLAIIILWGFFKIYSVQAIKLREPSARSEQLSWTFGQVMSLSLFLLPLVLVIARLYSANRDSKLQSQRKMRFLVEASSAAKNSIMVEETLETPPRAKYLRTTKTPDEERMPIPRFPAAWKVNTRHSFDPAQIQRPKRIELIQELLDDPESTCRNPKSAWLAICMASSCTFWIGLTAFAITLANNTPAFGKDSTAPRTSMTEFWFTGQAMIHAVLVYYPSSFIRDVILGFYLQYGYSILVGNRQNTPWAVLIMYGLICTLMHVWFFNLRGLSNDGNIPFTWMYSVVPFFVYIPICIFAELWMSLGGETARAQD